MAHGPHKKEGGYIRQPAVAGSFYPASAEELKSELTKYFTQTNVLSKGKKIKALLVPHAGTVFSGQTAAWGYRQLPHVPHPHFVLIGPSHHYAIDGLGASGAQAWQTPLGTIPHVPPNILSRDIIISDEAHEPEHDLEVQLPFLQHLFGDFTFTAFVTGVTVDIEAASKYLINQYPKSTFIISSDLSHYLPDDEAKTRDKKTIGAILAGDSEYIIKEDNVACGNWAIAIAIRLAKRYHWKSQLIMYDTSASAFGDTSQVVGYTSIIWYE